MPYVVAFIEQANQYFCAPGEAFDPAGLLRTLDGVGSVSEGIERFGLLGAIESEEQQQVAAQFIQLLPQSLDAAIMAALRSALERGLRTQFTWKPGYAFEVGLWESTKQESDGSWVGLVNIMIVSPDPPEDAVGKEPGTSAA